MKVLRRCFFHLLYHHFAWAYDFVAWFVSFGQWKIWIRSVLPHIQGEHILELGHGPGYLLLELGSRYSQVVGIDASYSMCSIANRRLQNSTSSAYSTCGYAQFLPIKSKSIDTIVSTFPTNYIIDDRVHQEVLRILKPEGQWIIALGVDITGTSLHHRLLKFLYAVTYPTSRSRDRSNHPLFPHISGFDAEYVADIGDFWVIQLILLTKSEI